MLKKIKILAGAGFALAFFLFFVLPIGHAQAVNLADHLKGRILLQVEARGEAWYVNPVDGLRYYLGRPADALNIMRQLGLGVANADFDAWQGKAPTHLAGRIILKVQDHGKAYYVYPTDLSLYYLGRPADALNVMRRLGLGITNADLYKIIPYNSSYSLKELEKALFRAVNDQRLKNSLPALAWNDDLTQVAREHSQNLARENQELTNLHLRCDLPIIHHEGFDFGVYQYDRLQTRGIYYFKSSGENIALMPIYAQKTYQLTAAQTKEFSQRPDCNTWQQEIFNQFKEKLEAVKMPTSSMSEQEQESLKNQRLNIVRQEIEKRKQMLTQEIKIDPAEFKQYSFQQLVDKTVESWMASEGHRANILDKYFDETGMGVAMVNGYLIATQVFISRASCGYQGGPCCHEVGYYPYCYVPLHCRADECVRSSN